MSYSLGMCGSRARVEVRLKRCCWGTEAGLCDRNLADHPERCSLLLRALMPVLSQPGQAKEEEAHQLWLTPDPRLLIDTLQIGTRRV